MCLGSFMVSAGDWGEVLGDAEAREKAYDISGAEAILKRGIVAFPNAALLQRELIVLYQKTQQWKKLEEYLRILGSPTDIVLVFAMASGYRSLADNLFTQRSFENARAYYMESGDIESAFFLPDSVRSYGCPDVAPETFRNAAAASSNSRNAEGIRKALERLQRLSRDPRCSSPSDQEIITNNLNDAYDMLSDMRVRN